MNFVRNKTLFVILGFAICGAGLPFVAGAFQADSANWQQRTARDPSTWSAVTATGAPTGAHSGGSAFTGQHALFWGGNVATSSGTNAGGLYDPQANTWTSITTTGAPSGRKAFAHAWTGTQFIVWGGLSGASSYLANGGVYTPSTNTWTTITATGAPASGRAFLSGAFASGKFFFWSGWASGSTYRSDGGLYDPVANSWSAVTATGAPSTRKGHCTIAANGKFIVFGGTNGTMTNTGAIYDPVGNSWTAMTTTGAPAARAYHSCAWSGKYLMVWGGDLSGGATNTGGLYNPATNTWSTVTTTGAPGISSDTWSQIAWTGKKFIVWGGDNWSAVLNTGGEYDPDLNTWTATSATGAPGARSYHQLVWTPWGMVVWGGTTAYSNGSSALATGGVYK